jgi:hypothetical protein
MKKLIVVLSIFALTVSANADLLTAWSVVGVNASTTPVFTNTLSGANITSNSCVLSLGAGVTASGTADTFGGTGFTEVSLANAITANDYISWILQADSGYQISVTNITWNLNRAAGTGASNLVLRSSFDGFTANLFTLTDFPGTTGGGDSIIPLSSLSGSNSVEFRAYIWSGSGATRFRNGTGNDLFVQGSVLAIPEPGSMMLMGLGLLGLTYLRRKLR